MRHFKMEFVRKIKRVEGKRKAIENKRPSVFEDEEDPYPSGKSFSKKEIRQRAEKLAIKKGWKQSFAEKVVRREIARIKMRVMRIPTGVFVDNTFTVKGYVIKYKIKYIKFDGLNLWRQRAFECNCLAGSNGYRCWHQDFTDYMLDGLTTVPQKYGPFHKSALLHLRKQMLDNKRR